MTAAVVDATQAETEVMERMSKEHEDPKLVLHENAKPPPVNMGLLQDMGFVGPIATPEQLRAAFDYQQRMFSAILSETDYLYTVTWTSDGKSQQRTIAGYQEAVDLQKKFANLGAVMAAKPKKSGIVKLAHALGISAKRTEVRGLPYEPMAQYSYVEYTAEHPRTGKTEVGVGWCDKGERGGKISTHDVIATADTRAYNRAVLRLAGFGDVSADEIIAGASLGGDDLPVEVPETPKQKALQPVPDSTSDEVLTASRIWAEAFLGAKTAAASKQETRSARELRAKARRGLAKEALQLGTLGLSWSGTCSDGLGYPTFAAGEPPVTPAQMKATIEAANQPLVTEPPAEAAPAPAAPPADERKGWDLSGAGSSKDDQPASEGDLSGPEADIPGPSPGAESITTSQAKKVSALLKEIYGEDKVQMKAWLKKYCHVDSSIHIRSNQYEAILIALKKKKKE